MPQGQSPRYARQVMAPRGRRYATPPAPVSNQARYDEAGVSGTQEVQYVLNMPRVIGASLVPVVVAFALSPIPSSIACAIGTPNPDVTSVTIGVSPSSAGYVAWEEVGTFAELSDRTSSYATHPEEWDFLCYDQGDEPWGSQLYQTGSIAETGCGLCSACHALSMVLGEEITPDVLAQQMQDYSESHGYIAYGTAGTVWAGWEQILEGLYGDRVTIGKVPTTTDAVREAVTSGKPVVYNAPAGGEILLADGSWRTTYGGHVLTCYRYEDGHFYVKDSSSKENGHGLGNAIAYSEEEFEQVMAQASGHLGYVYTFEANPVPVMD